MIPRANVLNWRRFSPWIGDEQVEQDLILSRILVELYKDPIISETLTFRGGTALQKLFINSAVRHSEDIDFVQTVPGPIGPIIDAIRKHLDPWLGIPKRKLSRGIKLIYRYSPVNPIISSMSIKIEINTREHFSILGINNMKLVVENPWFSGVAMIKSFFLVELLGTKMRALYQRKKGRDLFDLAYFLRENFSLKGHDIAKIFGIYMEKEGKKVSRAEFERNLILKMDDAGFREDILPLVSPNIQAILNPYKDKDILMARLIPFLPGDPWENKQKQK